MHQMIGHTVTVDGKLDRDHIEPLETHLKNVADRCMQFGKKFGQGNICRLVGLYHDLGKATDIFGKRVGAIPSNMKDIRYPHMTAGAKRMLDIYKDTPVGRLLATVIECHHGGLVNWNTEPSQHYLPKGESRDETFVRRLKKYEGLLDTNSDYSVYPEAIPAIEPLEYGCSVVDVDHFGINSNNTNYFDGFYGILTRLIFSCLIDADCLETEKFYKPFMPDIRENNHDSMDVLLEKLFAYRSKMCSSNTPINEWRSKISRCAMEASGRNRGLFTLEADVGGGKTVAMLTFALMHAMNHNMERVIYLAPFGSVIEQTADIFRGIFGENNICVHHMNMDTNKMTNATLMACDNWDAPIVVSSVQQFCDTMYSHQNTRLRKMHNFVNSVILFDEFHDIPLDKMWPTIHIINALTHARLFNSSVVLASATLPSLDCLKTTVGVDDNNSGDPRLCSRVPKAIIPKELYAAPIKRVDITRNRDINSWNTLAKYVKDESQCMVVVNTRQNAYDLHRRLANMGIEGLYHLSAVLTPFNRERILDEVLKRLAGNLPVRLICTPIVQTGVDISFPTVFREMCGQTGIQQAAGRCNRNAERDIGNVIVFDAIDCVPGLPRTQMNAMLELLMDKESHPTIESVTSIEYWNSYVQKYKGNLKPDEAEFDKNNLQALELDENDLSFESVSYHGHLIDDGQLALIVPMDDISHDIVTKFEKFAALKDSDSDMLNSDEYKALIPNRSDTRKIQRYTVHAYGSEENEHGNVFQWMVDKGYAHSISLDKSNKKTYILDKGYDAVYGIAGLLSEYKDSKPKYRKR